MSTEKSRKELLEGISDIIHREHYFIHPKCLYYEWIKQFIYFHQMQTRETVFVEPEKKNESFPN
jgi:hypothetical protein